MNGRVTVEVEEYSRVESFLTLLLMLAEKCCTVIFGLDSATQTRPLFHGQTEIRQGVPCLLERRTQQASDICLNLRRHGCTRASKARPFGLSTGKIRW